MDNNNISKVRFKHRYQVHISRFFDVGAFQASKARTNPDLNDDDLKKKKSSAFAVAAVGDRPSRRATGKCDDPPSRRRRMTRLVTVNAATAEGRQR